MKKILSIMFLFALLANSCSQDELIKSQSTSSTSKLFTASFEQNESRTYIEEGNLLRWTEGDQISLFDGNALNRQYKFDGKTGDNAGTFSIVSQPYGTGNDLNTNYAIYPYAQDNKITENGVITATLQAEQSYAENSFGLGANTMVAVTQNTDDTFLKFKNVCGYLKLQLYGDDVTVKSITLTGNNNEKLAGNATITPVYGQDPIINMATDAAKTITLDCGEGVKIGSTAETAIGFWMVIPPITFKKGLEVTITDVNGSTFTKSTSNEIVIERNIIKPMAAFGVEYIDTKSVTLTTAGTLSDFITEDEKYDITSLTISGPLNGTDILFIREMAGSDNQSNSTKGKLQYLDIRNASIVIGGNNYYFNNTNTTDNIINTYSFYKCTVLETIILPRTITSISTAAFTGCTNLKTINIHQNITIIDNWAFSDCTSLESISIPNNVINIGSHAFNGCTNLKHLIIEDGSTDLAVTAGKSFTNCPLETVYVGRDKAYPAKGMTTLKTATIGTNVTSIGGFNGCTNLTTVNILANNLKNIESEAFRNCKSLESLNIPNSVSTIGDYAFTNCIALTNAKLPENLETIGTAAFAQCYILTNIDIPSSVSSIGQYAFEACI